MPARRRYREPWLPETQAAALCSSGKTMRRYFRRGRAQDRKDERDGGLDLRSLSAIDVAGTGTTSAIATFITLLSRGGFAAVFRIEAAGGCAFFHRVRRYGSSMASRSERPESLACRRVDSVSTGVFSTSSHAHEVFHLDQMTERRRMSWRLIC